MSPKAPDEGGQRTSTVRKPRARKIAGTTLSAVSDEQKLDSAVEKLVDEWATAIPLLDQDVRAIAARIARVNDRLREKTALVLKQSSLSDFEFRLLAGLLRSGRPYRRAPTELAGRYVPVTSGGLTGLANRLEKRGLIARVLHPSDQRSILIELTPKGLKLAQDTMQEFAHAEQTLMADLSPADRAKGNDFLKQLLHSIETKLDL